MSSYYMTKTLKTTLEHPGQEFRDILSDQATPSPASVTFLQVIGVGNLNRSTLYYKQELLLHPLLNGLVIRVGLKTTPIATPPTNINSILDTPQYGQCLY